MVGFGKNSLADEFRALAARQPTAGEKRAAEERRVQELAKASTDFIEFVRSGAIQVAEVLQESGVHGSYYNSLKRSQSGIFAYELRKRNKYGSSSNWPYETHLSAPEYAGDKPVQSHTNNLVIVAETGKLAIVGWNAGYEYVRDLHVSSNQWFHEEAVRSPEDALQLQAVAKHDMETTIKKYMQTR